MSSYANKRPHMRTAGGQFRKMVGSDIGVGGVCPACNHLLLRHYDGDSRIRPLNPMKWRYRCFTCDPLTGAELALQAEIESGKPKKLGIMDILNGETDDGR